MKKHPSILLMPLICGLVLLAAGCNILNDRLPPATLYDLGPLPSNPAPSLPAVTVSVAEVTPSAWLDSPAMYYRLMYANERQPHAYAQHRWVMQPSLLFGQRLKARIAQAGGIAASAADSPTNLSLLRIEADDFTHVFETPDTSHGYVALRASIYHGRTLIAQKSFAARTPAPSQDAAGGAHALATASDKLIHEIITWLATLPLKR